MRRRNSQAAGHRPGSPARAALAATTLAALVATLVAADTAGAQDFTAALQTQPDAAARALLLRQIAAARALPRELARRRLLALAHGVGGGAIPMPATPDPLAQTAPTLADPAAALAFAEAVLRQDPANLDARAEAIRAALQTGQTERATGLAADAVDDRPADPSGWVLAAEVAQSANEPRMALADLARARDLRAAQLSSDMGDGSETISETPLPPPTALVSTTPATTPNPFATPTPIPAATSATTATPPVAGDGAVPIPDSVAAAANPANGTASPPGSYRTAQTYYTNPFHDQPSGPEEPATPQATGLDAAAASDPMTRQIDTTIAALQAKTAPTAQAEVSLTGRSGSSGLSGLGDIAAPMEATFSPGGYGRLKFVATPTLLFAGDLGSGAQTQAQFGTQALSVVQLNATKQGLTSPLASTGTASGVALDADYAYSWFEGDVGSTPLGFRVTNVVGGVTLSPQLTDNVTLRLIGERRAVTDSELAYAGAVDPRTGNIMGGVTRDRGYAQISISDGGGFWYIGAGGDVLRGENVASNSETEAGAGVNYPVWNSRTDEVRVGANLVYFGFAKNLDFFTLGQGGYFSPQSYEALLFPVSYSEQLGRLSYEVSGTIGVQTYHESGSLFFPTNPKLQAELAARVPGVSGLRDTYGDQGATGLSGGAHGEIQYAIQPNFNVGASADFERSGNFDQATGLIYARYTFDGVR